MLIVITEAVQDLQTVQHAPIVRVVRIVLQVVLVVCAAVAHLRENLKGKTKCRGKKAKTQQFIIIRQPSNVNCPDKKVPNMLITSRYIEIKSKLNVNYAKRP